MIVTESRCNILFDGLYYFKLSINDKRISYQHTHTHEHTRMLNTAWLRLELSFSVVWPTCRLARPFSRTCKGRKNKARKRKSNTNLKPRAKQSHYHVCKHPCKHANSQSRKQCDRFDKKVLTHHHYLTVSEGVP